MKGKFNHYLVHLAPSSVCPNCHTRVDMLARARHLQSAPSFWICWHCKRIWQIGNGPVQNLDRPYDMTVHFMKYGMTACLINGPPPCWPADHKWSSDWKDVTCAACLAGKELTHTFTISKNGKSITCLRCKRTSHNPNDVENHYCGHCHAFHDDIWPPARKAWLNQ